MPEIESYIHLYNYCLKMCTNLGKKEIIEDNKTKFMQVCKLFYSLHRNKKATEILHNLGLKTFAEVFIQIVQENFSIDDMLLDMMDTIGELMKLQADKNIIEDNYPLLFPRFKIPVSEIVEELKKLDNLLEGVKITNEFEELCLNNADRFGLYMFFNENKEIVYIGKANANLASKMLSAFKDKNYPDYVMLGYPNTKSDNNVYREYYICKYKPKLNSVANGKADDQLTIELPKIEFTDMVATYEKANINNYGERLNNMIKKNFLE